MNKLAIIDGDGLIYQSSKESLMESIDILDAKIQNIFDQTQATHYVIFISFTPYFRHSIDPNYKIGRNKYPQPLKWLKSLKSYLIEEYGAQSMKNVEADDLCAYWISKNLDFDLPIDSSEETISKIIELTDQERFQEAFKLGLSSSITKVIIEKILCSPDKDLLQSIPGRHFNYTYKLEDKTNPESVIKGWWVENNSENSYVTFWKSMICGDATDGIKGIEGRGISFADKLYDSLDKKDVFRTIILNEYCLKYGQSQGIFEFQKNYRLLRLLNCDQDFIREIGKLPEFPAIKEIERERGITIVEVPNKF